MTAPKRLRQGRRARVDERGANHNGPTCRNRDDLPVGAVWKEVQGVNGRKEPKGITGCPAGASGRIRRDADGVRAPSTRIARGLTGHYTGFADRQVISPGQTVQAGVRMSGSVRQSEE